MSEYQPKDNEILHYEHVSFKRDGKEILKDVNWHINVGENWALLGLNGSGKSTMLSLIPAIQTATSGQVRVLGYEFGKCYWGPIKARVGFVSSSLQTFEKTLNKQTVEKIIISGRYNSIGIYSDITDDDRKDAARLMASFHLTHRKDAVYTTLSSGERRRALLARAIMSDPELLVLDEPCSGLDLMNREGFLKSLNTMCSAEEGPSYVYVTHQIEEIMPAITHIAILRDGEIMKAGPKEDVLTSEVLSDLYGVPVRIEWESGRPWLIVKG